MDDKQFEASPQPINPWPRAKKWWIAVLAETIVLPIVLFLTSRNLFTYSQPCDFCGMEGAIALLFGVPIILVVLLITTLLARHFTPPSNPKLKTFGLVLIFLLIFLLIGLVLYYLT